MAGAASKSQERIREVANENYNATARGLSGVGGICTEYHTVISYLLFNSQNEDCGQMSAWYLFSALGFYPVDPISGEYIVGT